ncbi:hypothetical protein SPAB_04781 [Salmonella enterica subsp. enterica serovar Paratyphi B str. SPB7]|uniref:Uncharacterized protein n=1 Tax=Salmonella paratyphi B (strain ATCC BAA-1250 / SPB7) TaxID=1016998 RepID=A0A6C6Z7Z4_SALPB|nr:hypothetical protein SPAB_04781 [Salmonella enterica subsp. enterica serovar Paratyphi B str. SPB7]
MNFLQWISWWWRKKGLPTSITVLSRKRWKNYGAATVAWLAGPDSPYSGLSTPDQSAAWAALSFHANVLKLRN